MVNHISTSFGKRPPLKAGLIACLLIGLSSLVGSSLAQVPSLAKVPLSHAEGSSLVKPNLMFIIDDSGSMQQQYSPDYVTVYPGFPGDTTSPNTGSTNERNCRDSLDDGTNTSNDRCDVGDPPYMSPDFNTQYYNPDVTYIPPVYHDGTSYPSQNAANTSNWTSVATDPFEKQQYDIRKTNTVTTNLVSGFPERVWCNSNTDATFLDSTNATKCRRNVGGYSYPDDVFGYGRNSAGVIQYITGAPYYFRIEANEYCRDRQLKDCQIASAPGGEYVHPAPFRWCNSLANAQSATPAANSCQAKQLGTFQNVRFWSSTAGLLPNGRINILDSGSDDSVSITQIRVGGVNVINTTITAGGGTNTAAERGAVAQSVVNAINGFTSSPNYRACKGSGCNVSPFAGQNFGQVSEQTIVVIPADAAGNLLNDESRLGFPIEVVSPVVGTTRASGTLRVTNSGTGGGTISSITVGPAGGPFVEVLNGGVGNFGKDTKNNRNSATQAIADRINAYLNTAPWEYSARRNTACGGQSAAENRACIDAPVSAGAQPNGYVINVVASGGVAVSLTAFSGGAGRSMPTQASSISTSTFSRVDIVPSRTTYPRANTRIDCLAAEGVCTYQEEMTNFANWYAYYRSRLQMMKSSTGLAFKNVSDKFRVGFVTINHSSGSSSTKYLKINDFGPSHKQSWYSRLYGTVIGGGTPLRGALSRVGRMYAGSNPWVAADDPLQYSCQQNFALLTTDGYWNESYDDAIRGVDGLRIADEDNDLTTAPRPLFDGNQGGTCGGASAHSSCGTLADVAYHFYKNDLRPSTMTNCLGAVVNGERHDVCTNNVPSSASDPASYQHMTTFTLGLGLDGELEFREDYRSAASGDFQAIRQGSLNWPMVRQNTASTIDDLWHAAVNGHGIYFSAKSPSSLAAGLAGALGGVSARLGSGAAAATSNLEPVEGDNFAYVASFTTKLWVGNLESRAVDTQTGVVGHQALWCIEDVGADAERGTTACEGKLKEQIDANSSVGRNIFFNSGDGLEAFTWDNLPAELQAKFKKTNYLTQSGLWPSASLTAASGESLLSYLRGEYGFEDREGNDHRLYRVRERVLGDIVGSQPVFVKKPYFSFNDSGYAAYKAAKDNRTGLVLIGANDGMLHAFNADTGVEVWAFVPTMVMRNMWRLADANYENNHQYFVDGSITVSDICVAACASDAAVWKTILVGSLKAGGRGFYALDITDTLNPLMLWEFSSANDPSIGYSYAKPIITKRIIQNEGNPVEQWVVLVTSGLNNVPLPRAAPDSYSDENVGDGKGYLYVLNPIEGFVLNKIATGVGTTAVPSGLGKISAWSESPGTNNLTQYVYGGDLLGNLWRFDIKANTVAKIATLKDAAGTAQPITTEPELTQLTVSSAKKRFVMVGTGKLVFENDRSDEQTQSVYGFIDNFDASATTISDPRSVLVNQTLTATTAPNGAKIRTVSSNEVDLALKLGWYIDFPDARERVNVDPKLIGGTLVVPSNAPQEGICISGGYSWLNFFDFRTGKAAKGTVNNLASLHGGNALIVGMAIMKLGTGFVINVTLSDSPTPVKMHGTPIGATSEGTTARRVSWREIIQD